MSRLLRQRELALLVVIIVFVALVGAVNPNFLAPTTLIRAVNSSVVLMVVAIGVTAVILTRNIDVSVGATLGLTAAIAATLVTTGWSMWLVIPLALGLGFVLGGINGLGVAYLRIPAIVMTLGTLGMFRGVQFLYTGGKSIEGINPDFKALAGYKLFEIPLFVFLGIALVVAVHVALTRTRAGRWFYAVGDNVAGAHLVGIPTRRVVALAFGASGLMAALGGIMFAAQIGFVTNQAGLGLEIRAIAACVIGGVSLLGGVGSVIGAGMGAVLLTLITTSLLFLRIPGFWSDAVIGTILIAVLLLDARVRSLVAKRAQNLRTQGSREAQSA
jgi:AI-2 transport system permease protein